MMRVLNSEQAGRRVVIVGAGFGGLACAQALGSSSAQVTIVDRQNYHLFVPLLYQVATAALSPADIAEPIRKILRRHRNIDVVLGNMDSVDLPAREIQLSDGMRIAFDVLVLATGSRYNYFGHTEWEAAAPGLKTIADARRLRSRILSAFEHAEHESDLERQRALMTIIVVGGGPTGVEMAGAIAELARYTLICDFRRIDPASARVLLIEAGPRLLSGFPESLGYYAQERLKRLGVEVICNTPVETISESGVRLGGSDIAAETIIWGAGIQASEAGQWLGAVTDTIGRVPVGPDLSVPGMDEVYVIGDSASLVDPATGRALPALAQVAKQQGHHLGRTLRDLRGRDAALPVFRFRNRGNTAIIGRNAAVFDFGKWRLRGWLAWLLWAIVHVYLLVGFEKRLLVSVQWLWRYLTYQRGARLITENSRISGPVAQMDK